MSTIKRHAGTAAGRSRAVEYADLVFTVATSGSGGGSMEEQTRLTLDALDKNLADAGSDKRRIISATVYVTDISEKANMDKVWCEWIGPAENWPQRACVQAGLEGSTRVEITVVAARR